MSERKKTSKFYIKKMI